MICTECGAEFDPPREVAHLIGLGQIPRVCDACARPAPSMFTSSRPVVSTRRSVSSVLRRVDKFDPDGVVREWMALMPIYPKPGRKRMYRPGRPADKLRVFVMSERSSQRTGRPRTKLHTNLDLFQRQGVDFRAWKSPGGVEALTGIDNIALPYSLFAGVEDNGGLEVRILGKNGTQIRLLFKN